MGGKRSVERGTLVLLLLMRNEEEPLPDVKGGERGTMQPGGLWEPEFGNLTQFLSAPVRRLHGHVRDDERHDRQHGEGLVSRLPWRVPGGGCGEGCAHRGLQAG